MKATHFGICQVCGSNQKLPNGKLSKHGYTTAHGFFEGTCFGSDHLPFEISCDLIELSISRALEQRTVTVAKQRSLRASEPEAGKLWVHVYIPAVRVGRGTVPSYYRWELKDVQISEHGTITHTAPDYVGGRRERTARLDVYGCRDKSHAGLWAHQAEQHAKSLDSTIGKIDTYVAFQRDRIKNWKPTELRPVK